MERAAATWRLLNWSRNAFGRRCCFEVVDVKSLRSGTDEDFRSDFGVLVYDPTSGHIS